MADQFTWIPIYRELAHELLAWETRQPELIAFLQQLDEKGYVITSLRDMGSDGERFILEEIDPFTFFGVFNRGITDDNRRKILNAVKQHFGLGSSLPEDFLGIPVLFNTNSWFFAYKKDRRPDDIARLWTVFRLALETSPLDQPEFRSAFDAALTNKLVSLNLTMGLFWIAPDTFISLDRRIRNYLKMSLPSSGLNAKYYFDLVKQLAKTHPSFPTLSRAAFMGTPPPPPPPPPTANFWLVGAYWSDSEPADQTERFLAEGIWENGYDDKYLDDVRDMRPNDKIAIKAAFTQRKGLPFDADGHTVSGMRIKATGTIVANRGDGKMVEVEWDDINEERPWYFYTSRTTVWRLNLAADYAHKQLRDALIDFVWHGKPQDYAWFIQKWYGGEQPDVVKDLTTAEGTPYSVQDIIAEGIFLDEPALNDIMDRLRAKKALILQGAPGVGKTFLARKLAYALMEAKAPDRLKLVQFHQSYAYDDFVRGYRPAAGVAGNFELQDGVFFRFCEQARQDPEREYVFIIDEINRGNLSLIFGELLMLLEADKRGPDYAVELVYRHPNEGSFHIPSNVYVIGLMNIADRSLALVDYALRRRFAFVTLEPQYGNDIFRWWLTDRNMQPALVDLIVARMTALNAVIADDKLLGTNYCIGHSYFCPKGNDFAGLDRDWYIRIVQTEIAPLLQEYWYDQPARAADAVKQLLADG